MKSQNKSKNFGMVTQLQLTLVSVICLFSLLMNAKQCYASQDAWEKLAPMREQYQKIKTLHVKSSMLVESGLTDSPNTAVILIDYEHWEDSNGRYKTVYGFIDANGPVAGSAWEYAYNGQTFYTFERQSKTASYGEIEPNGFPLTPENPLLAPLLFLKDNSNKYHICPLRFRDILNSDRWQNTLAKSEYLDLSDGSRKAIKIPARMIDNARFDSYLYLDPNGLVEKIKNIGIDGNAQSLSISISEYQTIILDGKKTYWPKIIEIIGTDPADKSSVKLTAQIDLVEIDIAIPAKTFTVDLASAKSVWNNDVKAFVK